MSDNDDMDIADLRRIARDVDQVPQSVFASAEAAITTRDLDGKLAALVADSVAMEPDLAFDSVRTSSTTDANTRLLSFQGAGVQVDLEISEQGDNLAVAGHIIGSSAHSCMLQQASGREHELNVDNLGRFLVTGVIAGPARLRCQSTAGTRVSTPWVLL